MSTLIARLIAWFFVGIIYAVGPTMVIIAVAISVPTVRFVNAAIATDGKIIGLNRVYLPRRSKEVYLPVFRFTANDGQPHMIMADSNTNLVPFKPGDHVRVIYLKDHPETARIDSIAQLWMPQLIFAFFGTLFIVFSWRMYKRRTVTNRSDAVTFT